MAPSSAVSMRLVPAAAPASSSPPRAITSSWPTGRTTPTSSRSSRSASPMWPRRSKRIYTGEKMTMNFQSIDTRSLLQLLADTSGQNIVVSDSGAAARSVTLRLQNVPWDEALDIVHNAHQGTRQAPGRQRHHRWRPLMRIASREKAGTRPPARIFRNSSRCVRSSCKVNYAYQGRRHGWRTHQVQALARCCPRAAMCRWTMRTIVPHCCRIRLISSRTSGA